MFAGSIKKIVERKRPWKQCGRDDVTEHNDFTEETREMMYALNNQESRRNGNNRNVPIFLRSNGWMQYIFPRHSLR